MSTINFTKEQLHQLPLIYGTEEINMDDKLVVVKLFYPASNWTWYIVEFDGFDECWGLVDGFEPEFGYFTLTELSELSGPMGIGVERDTWFKPTKMKVILDAINKRY